MFIKETILACYIICIAGIVAGLTCAILSNMHKKNGLNGAVVYFLIGMLVICFYDLGIYYTNYVTGHFSSTEILRIGSCIISATMFMWLGVQNRIVDRAALKPFNDFVRKYLLVYAIVWFMLTFFLPVRYFYTVKWLLLASDVMLVLIFVSSAIAHIIYASVQGDQHSVYYMAVVTALLCWNYISYFWGETSVYWGNSRFIREPLDLTVVFWLTISIMSAFYVYKKCFKIAFAAPLDSSEPIDETEVQGHKDLSERMDQVCAQFKITPREREVMEQIYQGKSNKEIAEGLFLSESTVKTHIYNIFRKMDVKNRMGVIYILNEEQ